MSALYMGKLVTLFVISTPEPSIKSIQELATNLDYLPLVMKGTFLHQRLNDPGREELYYKLWQRVDEKNMPSTYQQAIEMLLLNPKLAYIEDRSIYAVIGQYPQLAASPPWNRVHQTAIMRKDFPFKHEFDHVVHHLVESGIVDKITKHYTVRHMEWAQPNRQHIEAHRLKLEDLKGIFYFLCFATLILCVILTVEWFTKRCEQHGN